MTKKEKVQFGRLLDELVCRFDPEFKPMKDDKGYEEVPTEDFIEGMELISLYATATLHDLESCRRDIENLVSILKAQG